MTVSEILNSNKSVLTAAEVAEVLETDPALIRFSAKNSPDKLGFNVSVIGTRTKIPRKPFLRFIIGYSCTDDLRDSLILLHPEAKAVLIEKFNEINEIIGSEKYA